MVDQERTEASSTQVEDKGQRTSTPVRDEPQDESLMSVGYPSPTTQYQEVIDQPPVSLLDLPDKDDQNNVSMEELIVVVEHEAVKDSEVTKDSAQ